MPNVFETIVKGLLNVALSFGGIQATSDRHTQTQQEDMDNVLKRTSQTRAMRHLNNPRHFQLYANAMQPTYMFGWFASLHELSSGFHGNSVHCGIALRSIEEATPLDQSYQIPEVMVLVLVQTFSVGSHKSVCTLYRRLASASQRPLTPL